MGNRSTTLIICLLSLVIGGAFLLHSSRDSLGPALAPIEAASPASSAADEAQMIVPSGEVIEPRRTEPASDTDEVLLVGTEPKAARSTGLPIRLLNDLGAPLRNVEFEIEWRKIRTKAGTYVPAAPIPGVFRTDDLGRTALPNGIDLLGGLVRIFGEPSVFGIGCAVEFSPRDRSAKFGPPLRVEIPRPMRVQGQVHSTLPIQGVTVDYRPGGPQARELLMGTEGKFEADWVSPLCTELRFARGTTSVVLGLNPWPGGEHAPLKVNLYGGSWVQGRVLDQHGEPIAGIQVEVRRPELSIRHESAAFTSFVSQKGLPEFVTEKGKTDTHGRFSLSVDPSEHRLVVVAVRSRSGGSSPVVASQEFTPAEQGAIDVILREALPSGTLTGVVLFRKEPVPEALVQALEVNTNRPRVVHTVADRDGRFELVFQEPGTFHLKVIRRASPVDHTTGEPGRAFDCYGPYNTKRLQLGEGDTHLSVEFPSGQLTLRSSKGPTSIADRVSVVSRERRQGSNGQPAPLSHWDAHQTADKPTELTVKGLAPGIYWAVGESRTEIDFWTQFTMPESGDAVFELAPDEK